VRNSFNKLATVVGLNDSSTDDHLPHAAYSTVPVTRDILGEQHVIAEPSFALKLIQKNLNMPHAVPDALSSIT